MLGLACLTYSIVKAPQSPPFKGPSPRGRSVFEAVRTLWFLLSITGTLPLEEERVWEERGRVLEEVGDGDASVESLVGV